MRPAGRGKSVANTKSDVISPLSERYPLRQSKLPTELKKTKGVRATYVPDRHIPFNSSPFQKVTEAHGRHG